MSALRAETAWVPAAAAASQTVCLKLLPLGERFLLGT